MNSEEVKQSAQRPPKKFSLKSSFDYFSNRATRITGSPYAFLIALAAVLVWATTGPLFDFSDTWQLLINTSTTIITFLMVFLIQQAQNKDTVALHLKLDELIAANKYASNRLVNVENLDEEALTKIQRFYTDLSNKIAEKQEVHQVTSIDELEVNVKKDRTGQSEIEVNNITKKVKIKKEAKKPDD